MDRKGFLRKACLAGVCGCGFGVISMKAGNKSLADHASLSDQENQVAHLWLQTLLGNLEGNLEEEELRKIIKMSSGVHYKDLKMDDLLSGYVGRLKEFIGYLETEWGWKVDYDETTGIILADENKTWCVCPVMGKTSGPGTAAICYCSEGFAEQMFSKVAGVSASATVISSVRRGDKSCIYRVDIPAV